MLLVVDDTLALLSRIWRGQQESVSAHITILYTIHLHLKNL